MLKVKPFFKWCDLWVGLYIEKDADYITVYICPFPTIGVRLRWHKKHTFCDRCTKAITFADLFTGPIDTYWMNRFLCLSCYEDCYED